MNDYLSPKELKEENDEVFQRFGEYMIRNHAVVVCGIGLAEADANGDSNPVVVFSSDFPIPQLKVLFNRILRALNADCN